MAHPRRDAPLNRDIPPQEQTRKWFRSHLLNRELELQELYDLPQDELDLLMAETAEIRSIPRTGPAVTVAGAQRAMCWNSPESSIGDAPETRLISARSLIQG